MMKTENGGEGRISLTMADTFIDIVKLIDKLDSMQPEPGMLNDETQKAKDLLQDDSLSDIEKLTYAMSILDDLKDHMNRIFDCKVLFMQILSMLEMNLKNTGTN